MSALRIEREPEHEQTSLPIGRILGWIVFIAVLISASVFVYNRWILPGRAPLVETLVVKPTVNIANAPLLSATGYLVADRQSKITPKISGKVVQMNFDVGDKVRKGDVLAVLESTNLQAQLDEMKAGLAEAEREYKRQTALWKDGLTTRANLDSAEAQMKEAQARVDQVDINMHDMVIRAPFDGTIASKNTEVGEVISSVMLGQVSGTLPAGAICTIVDLNTLEVVADVNEGSIGQVREGQPAEVMVDAFPNRKWRGVLKQIIPTADRAKAIVQVKVKILNPDEGLLPEMSATVNFLQSERSEAELKEPPRLWVPASAIADGRIAVVDANNRIEWRRVSTGIARENRIEIKEGLRDGERIVLQNPEQLRDRELVRTGE
ncbi:MAG TPA: efflux RND transporter periplasmic adaptor subunit [Thermoanaerobaculia bacterium]|nr:efflux RND transporter periplasmic adaptor subunit [Thermoanaerobaculia bacterium]